MLGVPLMGIELVSSDLCGLHPPHAGGMFCS